MGKVIYRELPEDHPLFKSGWLIATVKRPVKKDKNSSKNKNVVLSNKEGK
ncbi:hypothetical protein [Candidatus Pseudothioglobus singularis]|jgi:hypothetical protein|uniref:Uncharacterized protein n=1 Tax=Candidatus Pseudothioglobus singularis PS1 TaxID=1125411 RepID=A0A0M3T2E1_9GAMM|nr:hypothetical protein [Candidatus Pseudothioglobus singularis]ALE02691.1 hypothetical protein W908_04520 [Candidatus Pseudothioglobus singularis PS1]